MKIVLLEKLASYSSSCTLDSFGSISPSTYVHWRQLTHVRMAWHAMVWHGMELLFYLGKPLAMRLLFKAPTVQHKHCIHIHIHKHYTVKSICKSVSSVDGRGGATHLVPSPVPPYSSLRQSEEE